MKDPAAEPALLVDDRPGLEDVARHVRGARLVGLDVEANSLHAYRERVCVVQLTVDDESFILDPLALEGLAPLRDALDTDALEVVLHGGDYDIASLSRDYGFSFHRVFDTMVAATLLDEPKVGLADLVRERFGIHLDKKFQKADWAKRPLSPEQLGYLHRDTAYLPGLRSWLSDRLEAADLVEESEIEFRRLAARRGSAPESDPEAWRRMKGAAKLDARGRAVVEELWQWREGEAERRDVPPFKVLAPKAILLLGTAPPVDARDPRDVTALYPRERQRVGWPVLEAVRRGVDRERRGEAPLPDERPKRTPLEVAEHKQERRITDALRDWRRDEAKARKVPNLVVLPNRAVAWITRELPRDLDDLAHCDDIGPKRIERYGEEILDVLDAAGA